MFIFFAFKAIGFFLDINQCADTGSFFRDFQSSIDNARASSSTRQAFKINLDSSVEKVCFVDLNASRIGPNEKPDKWSIGDNFFIDYNSGGCKQLSNYKFEGINLTKITEAENPRCFKNGDSIQIKKTVYSGLIELE